LSFARTESRLSRSARDYVYLGPAEVNERGTREYFLWVGIASTIDRSYADESTMTPNVLYVELAGEPVEFELAPWADRVRDLAGLPVYDPAVDPKVTLAARVTLDQLSRFAQQQPDSVRIAVKGQPSIEYFLWREGPAWPAFSRYAHAED
jgi:hypothetical protein